MSSPSREEVERKGGGREAVHATSLNAGADFCVCSCCRLAEWITYGSCAFGFAIYVSAVRARNGEIWARGALIFTVAAIFIV